MTHLWNSDVGSVKSGQYSLESNEKIIRELFVKILNTDVSQERST